MAKAEHKVNPNSTITHSVTLFIHNVFYNLAPSYENAVALQLLNRTVKVPSVGRVIDYQSLEKKKKGKKVKSHKACERSLGELLRKWVWFIWAFATAVISS